MALSSVLPGITAYKQEEVERVADLRQDSTVSNSRYSVSGDVQGKVTVKDAVSSEVIKTFQMDVQAVIWKTFLLNGGKTIAASQRSHTASGDLETGREIRRFLPPVDSKADSNIYLSIPEVLPIPENKPRATTSTQIGLIIIDGQTQSISNCRLDTLIPELVTQDDRVIQRQEHTETVKQYFAEGDPRQQEIEQSMYTSLYWENNSLQLKILKNTPTGFWLFSNLLPGNYKLRFVNKKNGEMLTCFDRVTKKIIPVPGINPNVQNTMFIPIKLVQPVLINSNTVELDGVHFEVILPQHLLTIPPDQPNAATPVKLGIRITNHQLKPRRFDRYLTISMNLKGEDGKTFDWGYVTDSPRSFKDTDRPLIQPGESTTFSLDGNLIWQNNQLRLQGSDGFGAIWSFSDLKPGKYQIQMLYETNYGGDSTSTNLWSGISATPFVEMRLIQ